MRRLGCASHGSRSPPPPTPSGATAPSCPSASRRSRRLARAGGGVEGCRSPGTPRTATSDTTAPPRIPFDSADAPAPRNAHATTTPTARRRKREGTPGSYVTPHLAVPTTSCDRTVCGADRRLARQVARFRIEAADQQGQRARDARPVAELASIMARKSPDDLPSMMSISDARPSSTSSGSRTGSLRSRPRTPDPPSLRSTATPTSGSMPPTRSPSATSPTPRRCCESCPACTGCFARST